MKIEFKEITVRELTNGYQDNEEQGVVEFDWRIRGFLINKSIGLCSLHTLGSGVAT